VSGEGRQGARYHSRPEQALAVEDCGPWVPGWVLRLVVGAVSAAVVAVLGAAGAPVAVQVVFGLLAASATASPGSAAPAALGGGGALVTTVYHDGGALTQPVLALVVLVHLLHVTCGIAAVVPPRARLFLRALRRPLARLLLIQAAVFALAGLVAVAPPGRNPVAVEVLAVLGVAGLATLVTVQLRRR
jgi:hypothetical protein